MWTGRRAIPMVLATIALGAAMMSADSAGAEPAKCTLVRVAEWPVRPSRSQVIVDGAINGQKVGIMIDTGATQTMILRAAAERLGLVRHGNRTDRMFGIGGETAVETVSIDEFAIGNDVRKNWRMLVVGEHDFGDTAVILGENFMHQVDLEFDLAHDTIRLFHDQDCQGASLAYWATDGAGSVELEAIDPASPRIMLVVEINGRPVRAMLDSGASTSVLTKWQASSLGVTEETNGVVPAGCSEGLGQKPIENWIGQFDTFAIGNELIRNPKIRFADLWKYTTAARGSLLRTRPVDLPEMLLGADFLRSHRVLVAHSQRRMYFSHAGGTVFPVPRLWPCGPTPNPGEPKADSGRK